MKHLTLNEIRAAMSRATIITDDDEAKGFLLAENALSGLLPTPPHDQVCATWKSSAQNAFVFATNSKVPGDEGYLIVLFPFDRFTFEEACYLAAILSVESNLAPGTELVYEEEMSAPQN